ncbi:hypothetical protein MLD38_013931 [Melastoma candidum]|uniref:Uncharacterized protein n=1 Tax=Melastoma candidum TaxID=119954 RepID=A0ACB9RB49_9MYRT|nr:hypothetical protein MLD38_013931 [Melastoma candidum]
MAGQQPRHPTPSPELPPSHYAAGRPKVGTVFNKVRIATVVDKLSQYLAGTSQEATPSVFYNLCLSLARGIDYAVANNEPPNNPGEFPELLKQVCSRKTDCMSKSICMVLLLSAKNACNSGWFSEKDAHELLTLTAELAKNFYSPTDVTIGSSDTISAASTIMARFYPSFKLGKILASLDVKPGYGTHISDFHISKDLAYSGKEKIRLFVARTDNTETSACIISPQQVNFLLNGKAVSRRTNCNMDPGPQLPTNVIAMLKFGTNLLQAIGQFDGPCIIVVAFMSISNEHDHSSLLPYSPPHVTSPDTVSDSDIIEGPSRISLNCPISRTRIKFPVKGHSCKHLQCFDFGNFLEINTRNPLWRCPHCNRHVCYNDLRADHTLAKIMEEVADDINEVIISADGSWKAVMEDNDERPELREENLNKEKNVNPEAECTTAVVDLTEINDEMDIIPVCGSRTDNRKPLDSDELGNLSPTTLDMAWLEDSLLVRSPSLSQWPSNPGMDVPPGSSLSQPDIAGVPPLLPTPVVANQVSQNVPGPSYMPIMESQFLAGSAGHAAPPVNPNASRSGYRNIPALGPRTLTPGTPMQALSRPRTPVTVAQRPRIMVNQPLRNANPNQPPFQPVVQQPPQQPVAHRPRPVSPHQPSSGGLSNFSNPHLQQALNRSPSLSASFPSRPANVVQPWLHQRGNPTSIGQQTRPIPPNPIHMARQPPPMTPRPSPAHSQSQAPAMPTPCRNAAPSDSTPEQNFRPAGRMRGSLTGRPMDGLSHLIIQPTQLARPSGTPSGYSPSTEVSAPPHLQVQKQPQRNQ